MSPELKKLLIEWHDKAALEAVAPGNTPEQRQQALYDVAYVEALLFDAKENTP